MGSLVQAQACFRAGCGCRGPEPVPGAQPLVELAAAGLALVLWWRFPGSPVLLAYGPFTAALLALTVLDLEHHWLPDRITLPGIALGLGLAVILPHLSWFAAMLGALVGWAFLEGVAWGYRRLTGHAGLGGGDGKLLALIGAFLGLKAIVLVLLISSGAAGLVGLCLSRRRPEGRFAPLPFGPFLAGAALLALLSGPP